MGLLGAARLSVCLQTLHELALAQTFHNGACVKVYKQRAAHLFVSCEPQIGQSRSFPSRRKRLEPNRPRGRLAGRPELLRKKARIRGERTKKQSAKRDRERERYIYIYIQMIRPPCPWHRVQGKASPRFWQIVPSRQWATYSCILTPRA